MALDRKVFLPLGLAGLNYLKQIRGIEYTPFDVTNDSDRQAELASFLQEEFDLPYVLTVMDLTHESQAVSQANMANGAGEISSAYLARQINRKGDLFHPGFEFTETNIQTLVVPDFQVHGRNKVFIETIRKLKDKYGDTVKKMAYVMGPFTLFAELRGGEFVKDFYQRGWEKNWKLLVDYCTKVSLAYVESLAEVGVDVVVLLDPSSEYINMVGPKATMPLVFAPVQEIASVANSLGVAIVYHNCSDSGKFIDETAKVSKDGVDVEYSLPGLNVQAWHMDEFVDPAKAIPIMTRNEDKVVMGFITAKNLASLKPQDVTDRVNFLKENFGTYMDKGRLVLSVACDTPPGTPIENIRAILDAVKRASRS
jgi:uroporphyrinogen-III decarboxylase